MLFWKTGTTRWPTRVTTMSWLRDVCAWGQRSLWRNCSFLKSFILKLMPLAFPPLWPVRSALQESTSLSKGEKCFVIGRMIPVCLPGAFPGNRPSSFSCANKIVRQILLSVCVCVCFHGGKGHADCAERRSSSPWAPVLYHTAILVLLHQRSLQFMLIGNSFTWLKIFVNTFFPTPFSSQCPDLLPRGHPSDVFFSGRCYAHLNKGM